MRRRIAYLTGALGAGGIEHVVFLLATEMQARGHECSVCCFDVSSPDMESDLRARGIPLEFIRRRPGLDRTLTARLAAWMYRVRPDVLHMHNSTAYFYGPPAGAITRVRCQIATEHDGVFPRSRKQRWANKLLLAGPIDHAVAVSRAVKDLWCQSDRIARERVRVIPNGVPDTARPRAPHDGLRIGVVGRLSHEKGQDVLVRAFERIARSRSDVSLVFVGDGPVREALERQTHDLGIADRVSFLGSRNDVPDQLASFDVFVQPSRREGLPLAILEAMAASLPIVASNVGGIPEALTDGSNASLVPPEDPDRLADAIESLIDDQVRRERWGRAARERFEREYELSCMVDRYEELMD